MSATLQSLSTISNEKLCIGIDVAKNSHVAAFISPSLLSQHGHYKTCPTLKFDNSRMGFEKLRRTMIGFAPLSQCVVLLEKTGHYHRPLVQYLDEIGVQVFEIQIQKKSLEQKSDKIDAQSMANTLYNQSVLGAQAADNHQKIRQAGASSETALILRGLVRRRYELIQDATRRKNKLVAICDELFPEFSQVFRDVNCETALAISLRFPTPADIAAASLDDLKACRTGSRPSEAELLRLRSLAKQSIGVKTPGRINALAFEQSQLILELQLLQRHITDLDNKIAEIVLASREGRILLSFGCIGHMAAGAILATIGNIANFENAGKLRSLLGWAPYIDQTGISRDSMRLTKRGSRPLKQAMYLIGWRAIRGDTEWRSLYQKLVPVKCQWDQRTGRYKGKNKVIGRVIGQIIGVIFHLLLKDYEIVASTPPGEAPPPPNLYDRNIHRSHRH